MNIIGPYWNDLVTPLYPWVNTVNRILSNSQLPYLHGPTICLLSDVAGEHRTSRYEAISILAIAFDTIGEWEYRRQQVRNEILKDNRRISFKNLNDKRRKQALRPYLNAIDTMTGACITFVIRKDIQNLCSLPTDLSEFRDLVSLEGKWNPKGFERAIRLAHFVSLLIAGLTHPNQNVYWISDEDNIFANRSRSQDVNLLASYFTSYYARHPLGELGIGTTQIDENDLRLEDLVALPDLLGGALAEVATSIAATYNGHIPLHLALDLPAKLSSKTKSLVDWLADDGQLLKRPIIVFDLTHTGLLQVSRLNLSSLGATRPRVALL